MQFTDVKEFIKYLESRRRFDERKDLSDMEFYASLFGHPENSFKSILVAGTNGKGSTVAYLRSIYEEANLKIATFTSPYITCFNERIYYDHHFIEDEKLLEIGNIYSRVI